MKSYHKIAYCIGLCLIIVMISFSSSFADEASNNWRQTYDLVMKWVNFFILAFVLIYFGKRPFMNFLNGRKDAIAREIKMIEDEKQKMVEKVQQTAKELEESEIRFQELKQKIISKGEKEKAAIIEEARTQAKIMFETAKQKLEGRIMLAKQQYKEELIDAAINLAMESLPAILTADDNKKMVNRYIKDVMHIVES